MNRRKFSIMLGGAAGWPLAASAQQDKLRLIGIVAGFSEDEMRPLLAAFRSRLSQLGWIEGRNVAIDAKLGAGDYKRMTEEAGVLVGRNPDVIVVLGTPGLTAVRQHTHSVPVVFTMVADPVRTGMIESLARPGGHATGFTNFEFSVGGKWLELLKDIRPSLRHVTTIANPANPTADPLARFIEATGRSIDINVTTAAVRGANDIEAAVTIGGQQPEGGTHCSTR